MHYVISMVCHTKVSLIMNNTPDANDSQQRKVFMKQSRGNSVSVGIAASYFALRGIKLS